MMRHDVMGRPAAIGAGILAIAALALALRSGGGHPPALSPAQSIAARFANDRDDITGSVTDAVATRERDRNALTHLTFSPSSLANAELPPSLIAGRPPEADLIYAPPVLDAAAPATQASAAATTEAAAREAEASAVPHPDRHDTRHR